MYRYACLHLINYFIQLSLLLVQNCLKLPILFKHTNNCGLPIVTTSQFDIIDITWGIFLLLRAHVRCLLLDSIGSVLCARVLNVLFDVWILSCAHCFPAPSLWKTLQEMCSSWRHHDALVAQWHRVNIVFTTRLLRNIYGTTPQLPLPLGILLILTICWIIQ